MKKGNAIYKLTSGLGILLLALILVIAVFVVAELSYRQFVGRNQPKFDLGYLVPQNIHVSKPYVMFTSKPGYQQYGTAGQTEGQINTLGYLGHLPSPVKPKNEYRIFLLGGSAAFFGAPPFSVYLEKLFQRAGRDEVKVFNFSVIAGVSRQELVRLMIDIAGYQPDLVISYTGYNDLFDTGWDPRINYPHRYILNEINPVTKPAADFKFLPTLALASQYLRDHFPHLIFEKLTENLPLKKLPPRQSIRPLIAKSFVQNLRLSKNLSQQLGADYVAFFQPTVFFKKTKTAAEKNIFDESQLLLAEEIRIAVNTQAKTFTKEFHFIDASELFGDEQRTAFVDAVHYTRESWTQELIAKYIYDQLNRTIDWTGKIKPTIQNLQPEEDFTFTLSTNQN